MAMNPLLFCFAFLCLASLASPAFISDEAFNSRVGGGRLLLQNKKSCPIDFKHQNYTIITSNCIGPQYTNTSCCPAFKEFACPFVDYINDLTTDCAESMFNYINKNGYYPNGLFAERCQENKKGLDCSNVKLSLASPSPAPPPSSSPPTNNGDGIVTIHSIWHLIISSSVLLLIL